MQKQAQAVMAMKSQVEAIPPTIFSDPVDCVCYSSTQSSPVFVWVFQRNATTAACRWIKTAESTPRYEMTDVYGMLKPFVYLGEVETQLKQNNATSTTTEEYVSEKEE